MSQNHKEFLASKGLNYTTASRGVQKKMTEYNQLETEINKLKSKDLSEASDALKQQTANQIAQAEETLAEINDEVIRSYEKWEKTKPQYAQRVKEMNAAKAAKKAGGGAAAPPQPPAPIVPIVPIVEPEPAPVPAASTEPVVVVDDKKSGISWGWVVGIAATVVLGFVGIRYVNNR